MLNSMKNIPIQPDDHSWAQVELYRWQHNELPPHDPQQDKGLNESIALNKMADALEAGCKGGDVSKMPSPFGVVSVLRYIATQL